MAKNDFDIEKLKGVENYHTWSFAVENYLAMNQLEDCIKVENDVVIEKDSKKLTQAKARLVLSVDKTVYVHIRNCASALEIWNTLKKLYEDKGLMRKIGLLRTLISVRLENSNNMKSYVEEIIGTANKLTDIGFEIGDDWLGAILLAGLTDEYKPMIMSIESSNTKISAEIIKSKLLDMNSEYNKSDSAFYSKSKNSKQKHYSYNTSKNYKPNVKSFKCYTCGGKNHKSSDCNFNKNSQNKSANKQRNETVKHAFTAMSNKVNNETWFIDSGASSHMTPDKNVLHNKRDHIMNDIIIADQ